MKQYRLLRTFGGTNCILITPGKREFGPLLRRGWVEPAWPERDLDDSRFLPPLRLTADGLRALADAVDAHGQPSPEPDDGMLAMRGCRCERGEMPSTSCPVHSDAAEERRREHVAAEFAHERLRASAVRAQRVLADAVEATA